MSTETTAGRSNADFAPKTDLLSMCRQELDQSVGLDNDQVLIDERERALNYIKGDMAKDIPLLKNRSKAVSSDINDAIETTLPDLLEIFIGGDDVVSFIPRKEEDEDAAEQETAYLNQVVFQDNPGFDNFYEAFKDALTLKTGLWGYAWKQDVEECEEKFTGKNIVELQMAAKDGEISDLKPDQEGPITQDSTFSFTLSYSKDNSKEEYWSIPPDDFSVALDTVRLSETTYCVWRTRPRAQDLIAEGYDEDKVSQLPAYTDTNTTLQQARDTAGENFTTGSGGDDSVGDLRQVEILKHHIRVLGEDNKLELWCLVTDTACAIELSREKAQRIPYAAITPYKTPHRFYGRSLADMLFDVQRIKTMLLRMLLDSGYFAQNQRAEISMADANEFTVSDYLRNEPGVPVRSKTGNAIKTLEQSGLNFNAYEALEYFSTVAESRTGVVRNAQGLNPDTLHDTAKGALTLLAAAQKRVKMIARIFAETGVKDLYLGIHADIRENARASSIARLLGKWIPVDPSKWAERNAMTVSVGLGASGKDMDIAAMNQIIGLQKTIVEDGGLGMLVSPENLYHGASTLTKKLGVKNPDQYFTDPANVPPQPPKPDPEMAKVQGEQQLAQQKQQGEMQLQTAKQQGEMALGQLKVQAEKDIQANKSQMQAAADQHKQELEHERELQKQQDLMALETMKLASAERTAIEVARINNEGKIEVARISAKNQTDDGASELQYQKDNETTA